MAAPDREPGRPGHPSPHVAVGRPTTRASLSLPLSRASRTHLRGTHGEETGETYEGTVWLSRAGRVGGDHSRQVWNARHPVRAGAGWILRLAFLALTSSVA